MSDYIRREDAVDTIKKNFKYLPGYMNATINYIKELPSADVVPVIRCADCALYIASRHWCGFNVAKMYEHDFCSYGKKREEHPA